ncbi:SDR family NAD(P)-dependent oxidoreductase [Micromonospora inositola]|uniref:NAD(P)-dependent dehydrogenase, short-chain alcohol dehydrogenase family n=1 Tax=Micromonospora inositola TaxID=47865 RepID=A0A1C5K599_9ACTN|nr:SDR family oxidoreductase [Micromonospora inositola]SCG77944.1 NAD(P)-dependent dehydrogenase, short-chain alcohol dehydrogenase family [Micromonospora inositola]
MRHVIVSGGTSGIGLATVRLLLERGWRVSTFGVRAESVAAARSTLGATDRCRVGQVDMSDADAVTSFVAKACEQFGTPWGLVNNAAVRHHGDFFDTELDVWDATFATNVRGLFVLTRAVAPRMRDAGGGSVVNLASGSGYGRPNLFAYCASKGAVLSMTKAMALDVAAANIRVNAVLPGSTYSEMVNGLEGRAKLEFEQRAARNNVMGRPNDPQEVAEAIAWVLSDEARTVSGTVLEVGTLPRYSN